MNLKVFTVFDSKVGAYMRPFFCQSTGEAMRAWVDTVNDPQTAMNKHPEDYTLFELGTWNDTGALFTQEPTPKSLGVAVEVHRTYHPERVSKLMPVEPPAVQANH